MASSAHLPSLPLPPPDISPNQVSTLRTLPRSFPTPKSKKMSNKAKKKDPENNKAKIEERRASMQSVCVCSFRKGR